MPQDQFRNFIDYVCMQSPNAEPMPLESPTQLDINGIAFTLMDGGPTGQGDLVYFCKLGPVPANCRTSALRQMLEVNLVMLGINSPSFSINYDSGQALLMGRLSLGNKAYRSAFESLLHYAGVARQWRSADFLPASFPESHVPIPAQNHTA